MISSMRVLSTLFLVMMLTLPGGAIASEPEPLPASSDPGSSASVPQKSIDQISREMTNPLAPFYRFDYTYQHRSYRGSIPGADDQSDPAHSIQGTIPFREKNGKGWLFRFALAQLADQPIYWVDEPVQWSLEQFAEWEIRQVDPTVYGTGYWRPTHGHTDDMTIELVYGGVDESGLILSYGLAGVLPTSSDTSNARQQLILGPAVNIGKMTGWGAYGVLFSHVIDVAEKADKGTQDTSQSTLQAYFSYHLGHAWQVVSNPTITYDWEADSGNKLNLPLGGGIAKAIKIGNMPVRMAAEAQYFVASSDRFGPDWMFEFSVSPVIPGKHTRQ